MNESTGTQVEIVVEGEDAKLEEKKGIFAAAVSAPAQKEEDKKRTLPSDHLIPTRISEIKALIHDPEVETKAVIDILTAEMSIITAEMVGKRENGDLTGFGALRVYTETIKALKELRQSVLDGDAVTRRDELNYDGEKLKTYMADNYAWFTAANSVWKNFRDIAQEREPETRRKIQQLGMATRRK